MIKRRLLDTNLIIRHLVQDNASQAKVAGKLFAACDHGEIILIVLSAVVAEAVFVLESFYNHAPHNIAQVIGNLLASPGIELIDEKIHQTALVEYGRGKHHFVDCLIGAYAKEQNWPVASFDQGFRKRGVQVDLG
jgi:predicted nucleic-acid-binding protein